MAFYGQFGTNRFDKNENAVKPENHEFSFQKRQNSGHYKSADNSLLLWKSEQTLIRSVQTINRTDFSNCQNPSGKKKNDATNWIIFLFV